MPGPDTVTEVVVAEFVKTDLRIVQAPLFSIPVLNDPVVGPFAVGEVAGEPTSSA